MAFALKNSETCETKSIWISIGPKFSAKNLVLIRAYEISSKLIWQSSRRNSVFAMWLEKSNCSVLHNFFVLGILNWWHFRGFRLLYLKRKIFNTAIILGYFLWIFSGRFRHIAIIATDDFAVLVIVVVANKANGS